MQMRLILCTLLAESRSKQIEGAERMKKKETMIGIWDLEYVLGSDGQCLDIQKTDRDDLDEQCEVM